VPDRVGRQVRTGGWVELRRAVQVVDGGWWWCWWWCWWLVAGGGALYNDMDGWCMGGAWVLDGWCGWYDGMDGMISGCSRYLRLAVCGKGRDGWDGCLSMWSGLDEAVSVLCIYLYRI
jgi:hypothetical protein